MRNEIKRARVALQSELMKQQHWIAIPPGKMPLGKKSINHNHLEGSLNCRCSWDTWDKAEQPEQWLWPGRNSRDYATLSVGTVEKPHLGLVHRDGDAKPWESH